jgi:uncharacterized protein (DUF427 family)
VQYVAADDIDQSVLRPSETSSYCPYKGEAGYFSVDIAGHEPLEDVAWFYEEPYAWVAEPISVSHSPVSAVSIMPRR